MARRPSTGAALPAWFDQYHVSGKIGEGTYGLVYLATLKDDRSSGKRFAIKKIKHSKDGDGVSITAIREIMVSGE